VSIPVAVPAPNRAALELIELIVREAMFMADLTAHFLERLGILPPPKERRENPVELPTEFLVELGAIVRLALWERAELRDRLDYGLPRAEHALADLFARFAGPVHEAQSGEVTSRLASDVLRVSLRRLAWGGPEELHADVVLDEPDGEVLLEALADLLWEHRHVGRDEE
jgi:hypothetical protein